MVLATIWPTMPTIFSCSASSSLTSLSVMAAAICAERFLPDVLGASTD